MPGGHDCANLATAVVASRKVQVSGIWLVGGGSDGN